MTNTTDFKIIEIYTHDNPLNYRPEWIVIYNSEGLEDEYHIDLSLIEKYLSKSITSKRTLKTYLSDPSIAFEFAELEVLVAIKESIEEMKLSTIVNLESLVEASETEIIERNYFCYN